MKIDEDYYAGLGIPKNATNIRVRALTADEKDKCITQLEEENAALKRGIRDAINDLGVPNAGYPSPVAEAWAILAALLTSEESDDDTPLPRLPISTQEVDVTFKYTAEEEDDE